MYSRMPDKRLRGEGENSRRGEKWFSMIIIRGLEQSGGLEMARYDKSQGIEQSGGEEEARQIKSSHFSFS